jgi:hypothetical protein
MNYRRRIVGPRRQAISRFERDAKFLALASGSKLPAGSAGITSVIEWNAYRYAALRGKGGASGVLLFGISRRAYGGDATNFLRRLKSARPAEVNAFATYPLPVVRPTD